MRELSETEFLEFSMTCFYKSYRRAITFFDAKEHTVLFREVNNQVYFFVRTPINLQNIGYWLTEDGEALYIRIFDWKVLEQYSTFIPVRDTRISAVARNGI